MASHTDEMRKFMMLAEAKEMPYTGPNDSPNIKYKAEGAKGEITKVIAQLESYDSGRYTKMGRNLNRIKWLNEQVDKLTEEVKQDTRGAIADLFHAEDAARTRVVDTVSFIFTMTKDPAPTTTVQYSKVLEALQEHLTPELIAVMEGLKAQFSSVVQKAPALIKAKDKAAMGESIVTEGIFDSIKAIVSKFYQKVTAWGTKYDAKLAKLKSMANVHEEMDESDNAGHTHEGLLDELIKSAKSGGTDSEMKITKLKDLILGLMKD